MKVITKSWDELIAEFGVFNNENNFGLPEIHLKNDDYYINGDWSMVLGKTIEVQPINGYTQYFTREDGGHYISNDMIKG